MTDKLDAIKAALARMDATGTPPTEGDLRDWARWLFAEVERARAEREEWRTTANRIAEMAGEQEVELGKLRERHAAAVQKAYREGFGKGWGQGWDHGDLARPCDAAWLASEARKAVARDNG